MKANIKKKQIDMIFIDFTKRFENQIAEKFPESPSLSVTVKTLYIEQLSDGYCKHINFAVAKFHFFSQMIIFTGINFCGFKK